MHAKAKRLHLAALLCALSVTATAAQPGPGGCLDLVADCGGNPSGQGDSTASFVRCQELAAGNEGGGCVFVPTGHYRCIAVPLNRSNIVWRMGSQVVFSPRAGMTRVQSMFMVGAQDDDDVSLTTNVSIVGLPARRDWFTIDISRPQLFPWNVRAVQFLGGLSRFTFANAVLKMANPHVDPEARFEGSKSGLEFNAISITNETALNPRLGLIANVTSTGGIYGYGTTQVQGLVDSHFENLDGTGGITLRLETGVWKPGKTVANITARNITCRDGHSAVMSGPHNQVNGHFEVRGVRSYGCHSAVGFEAGFGPHGPPGTYNNDSFVDDVLAVFGTRAQTYKNLTGASCSACDDGEITVANYRVTVTNARTQGFPAPADRSSCVHWERWGPGAACPRQGMARTCLYNSTKYPACQEGPFGSPSAAVAFEA